MNRCGLELLRHSATDWARSHGLNPTREIHCAYCFNSWGKRLFIHRISDLCGVSLMSLVFKLTRIVVANNGLPRISPKNYRDHVEKRNEEKKCGNLFPSPGTQSHKGCGENGARRRLLEIDAVPIHVSSTKTWEAINEMLSQQDLIHHLHGDSASMRRERTCGQGCFLRWDLHTVNSPRTWTTFTQKVVLRIWSALPC